MFVNLQVARPRPVSITLLSWPLIACGVLCLNLTYYAFKCLKKSPIIPNNVLILFPSNFLILN